MDLLKGTDSWNSNTILLRTINFLSTYSVTPGYHLILKDGGVAKLKFPGRNSWRTLSSS